MQLKGLAAISERLSQISEPLAGWIQVSQMLSKAFQQLPQKFEESSETLKELADRGWFVPIMHESPSFLFAINDMRKKRQNRQIDKHLIEYYIRNSNTLVKKIIQLFPHRKKVLSSAFKAHLRSDYYLSIPVFLSQTEGITK